MSTIIDARRFSCPQPVLMTLDRIKAGEQKILEVLVDTYASVENVTRAVKTLKWKVQEVTEEDGEYRIVIEKIV
jgi:tRNA 2-thiouridine synthesizing protein A